MIGQILNFAAAFLIGWIGIGSGIIYGRTSRKIYWPLSQDLVVQGIYSQKVHRQMMIGLYSGCIIMMVVALIALLCLGFASGNTMTWVMAVIGIGLGLFKGRNAMADPRVNVANFVRSRKIFMNKEKAEAYFAEKYNL
ncbi:MAG: hypothetical protein R3Y62_06200 [Eubacteriales bacterium]